jgi:hypothetical protein
MFILLSILTIMARGEVVHADESVTITNAFCVNSPYGKLNVVEVNYEFPGRQYVLTDSHGILSAKGTLRFMTDANTIEFRDPNSKELLGTANIGENTKVMGTKELPIPRESNSPPTFQTDTRKQNQPLDTKVSMPQEEDFPYTHLIGTLKQNQPLDTKVSMSRESTFPPTFQTDTLKQNQPLGTQEVSMPQEEDFPHTHLIGRWKQNQPFADNLIEVLNRHFLNGYLPRRENEDQIFITRYKQLDVLTNNKLKARVAIMVKVPFSTTIGKPVQFQLFFLGQERRSLTQWRAAENEDVMKRINNFVSQLMEELAGVQRDD